MSTIIQDSSSSSGAAAKTIGPNIATSISDTISAWNSTVSVDCTAPGLIISLPVILITDIGTSITIINTGLNQFQINFPTGTFSSIAGTTIKPGETWTIEAQTTSTCTLIGSPSVGGVLGSGSYLYATAPGLMPTIAVNDHFRFTNVVETAGLDITLDTATPYVNTNNTNSLGRFRLQPGTYKLEGTIGTWATASGFVSAAWWNVDAGAYIQLNAANYVNSPASTNTSVLTNNSDLIFTCAVPTRIEYRIRSISATSLFVNDTNGIPTAVITQLSKAAPVVGYSQDFALLGIVGAQAMTLNTDITWNMAALGTFTGGLSGLNANSIQGLQIGRKYLVTLNLSLGATSALDTFTLTPVTNTNVTLGPGYVVKVGGLTGPVNAHTIQWVITPTVATGGTLKIRATAVNGTSLTIGDTSFNTLTTMTVQQIDGTPVKKAGPPKVTVFSSAGAQTWIKDPEMTYAIIEACGGGGSAAGMLATSSGQVSVAGSGGAGAYAKVQLSAAQLVNPTYAVTVGAGGAAPAVAANGNAGGTTGVTGILGCPGGSAGILGGTGTSSLAPANAQSTVATAVIAGSGLILVAGSPASGGFATLSGGFGLLSSPGMNPMANGIRSAVGIVPVNIATAPRPALGPGSGSVGGVSLGPQGATGANAGGNGRVIVKEYFD